jgi:ketosteroid isomerase-like protein
MSRENVEFVEALLAAAGEMDKQAILEALPEVIAQTCAPDIEWIEDPQRLDSQVYRGHQGVLRSWERWLEHWDDWAAEVERFVDCGENVLVIARERGRGTKSGASVSSRNYLIFTIRDAKITRYQEFYDERAALAAAGLAE